LSIDRPHARFWHGALAVALSVAVLAGCGSHENDAASTQAEYVALGDSYTAAPYVPVTSTAGGCFRSSNNYPSLVARALKITSFTDRSCGGATTADMTKSQMPGIPPQLDALRPSTRLVTLGIGGNDFGFFSTLIVGCPNLRPTDPTGAPCEASATRYGPDMLLAQLAKIRTRVEGVIKKIRKRAPHAQILIMGAPQIFPSTGTCAILPLATGDYPYALKINKALNDMGRAAAAAEHVGFINIWPESKGHDICSADPWINGSVNQPTKAAAYHPFAAEQRAVARLVEAAVKLPS
jgi:lysophospholipase L1-like esterase